MRRWVLIAAAILSLTGCDEVRFHKVKALVRLRLVDPQSAEFRNLARGHGDFVCGEVNGRNPMGGYSGFMPFAASLKLGEVYFFTREGNQTDRDLKNRWALTCE